MGGDHSQKLLPRRGILLLSGAQTSGSLRIQHCSGKLRWELADATFPGPSQPPAVARLQTAWVTFGKQTWVTSPARRRSVAGVARGGGVRTADCLCQYRQPDDGAGDIAAAGD